MKRKNPFIDDEAIESSVSASEGDESGDPTSYEEFVKKVRKLFLITNYTDQPQIYNAHVD